MKKTKLLFVIACCLMLAACNNNSPEKGGEQNQELNDLIEGIGKIVDTQTLDDGSTVMTDSNGNIITIDKEGNTVIVAADGEKTVIDNSIKEDKSAPKDKWYNTKWISIQANEPIMDPNWEKRRFLEEAERYGFQINGQEVSVDSSVVRDKEYEEYELYIRTTTAAMKQISTNSRYTANRTYQFLKYPIETQSLGDESIKFVLKVEDVYGAICAAIFQENYDYDQEQGSFFLTDRIVVAHCPIDKDNALYIENGYQTNSENEQVLSKTIETTLFNFRRLSDTKLAASNNSVSYIIEEETEERTTPELVVYTMEGYHVATFELESL